MGGPKYVDNFEFPSDFGFTGSAGRVSVKPHSRGPRQRYAKGGPVRKAMGGPVGYKKGGKTMRDVAKEEVSKHVSRPAPKGHKGLKG